MAKPIKITAANVLTVGSGRYHLGNGLHLNVQPSGRRNWSGVLQFEGRRMEVGHGCPQSVKPIDAREAQNAAKALARRGVNPKEALRAQRSMGTETSEPASPPEGVLTFGEFADQRIVALTPRWDSKATLAAWKNCLGARAAGIRDMPLADVRVQHVLTCLEPEWLTKAEVSRLTQERMKTVFGAAIVLGLHPGPNPAAWEDLLEHLLAPKQKLSRGPHAALPYEDAPGFLTELRTKHGNGSRALELAICSGVRTGEARLATWKEFDLDAGLWRIPLVRVKIRVRLRQIGVTAHVVPISPQTVSMLRRMAAAEFGNKRPSPDSWVFPGQKRGQPISSGTMERVLDRMAVKLTVHGFRSTLRDWAGDETIMVDGEATSRFSWEACEITLGHLAGNAVSRAYRRGQCVPERRRLLRAWADYLDASNALALAA